MTKAISFCRLCKQLWARISNLKKNIFKIENNFWRTQLLKLDSCEVKAEYKCKYKRS